VSGSAAADLAYGIRGVDDPLKSNILSHIDTVPRFFSTYPNAVGQTGQ